MRRYFKYTVLLVALLFVGFTGFAQPDAVPGKGPKGRPPGPPRPAIPIDGGISILAAAGVAYGARKLYLFNKNAHDNQEA
ncbi:hypothetical protein D770_01905 [Flammeovirgaceae bacterium 311]|nr:hypothetical protein D770_01905 [Flammeovirgaceae bacterium 311]